MTTFQPLSPNNGPRNSDDAPVSPSADDEPLASSFDFGEEPGAPSTGDGDGVHGAASGGDNSGGDVLAPRTFTRDEFFAAFIGCFKGANVLVQYKTGEALRSLDIAADDPAARAASDAIYDTALEVPWLHWLLSPGNKWVQRIAVIGAFGFTVSTGVAAELKARRPTPVKPTGAAPQAAEPQPVATAPAHVDGQELK